MRPDEELGGTRIRADFWRHLLVLCLTGAPGPLAAQTSAPDLVMSVEIDTTTGHFSAEAMLAAPQGEIVLPSADWLVVETVDLAAGAGDPGALADRKTLDPDLHRNMDLRITVSGQLPAPQQPPAAVAWSTDATYAIGPEWFPVDGVAIRDHDIAVTVTASQRVAATGTLVSDIVAAGYRETRYVFTGRSSDVGLFLGRYVLNESVHRDYRLRTYFEAVDSALSERYFAALSRYLDRYELEIGSYPYDGFSVVSAPIPMGLGFAGLTYVSQDILAHPYMTGRSLAHEVLHSWWGNAVGVDYASGNWAEGLTTFQADYALAEESGEEAARDMRIGWIRDLARLSNDQMSPLTAFRAASHAADQSEGYGKAALVFHMLRDEVGAEPFRDGIQAFYSQNRNRIAGWADLRAAFETGAGRDLGWFFDQWIERVGLPRIEITAAELRETADGTVASLSLQQDEPAYRLRVPVIFDLSTGTERRVIEITGEAERIEIPLSEPPRAVTLDPDFDLARRPLDAELAPILRSIGRADTIRAIAASPLGGQTDTIARLLSPATGASEFSWQDGSPPLGDAGTATLIAGFANDVADLRPAHLGPQPAIADRGATRLWLERDSEGGLWAFLSFEDARDVEQDLRALRYYVGQSYLAVEDGRAVDSGIWDHVSSAGRVRFVTSAD